MKTRITFAEISILENLEEGTNVIVEVRTADPMAPKSVKSIAWTVFALHDPAGEI